MSRGVVIVLCVIVLAMIACGVAACLSFALVAPIGQGFALPGLAQLGGVAGSGRVITESREVRDFSALAAGGSGDVVVVQGDSEGLVIEAENNLMPYISSEVVNGTLRLGFTPPLSVTLLRTTRPIRYLVTVKTLESVSLNGSGSLAASALRASRLQVTVLGSGSARVDQARANEIVVDMRGSGNVDLSGKASRQTVTIAGSGGYRAGNLDTDVAQVTVLGSGSATVWSRQQLSVQILGSGPVRYYGEPTVTRSIQGSGGLHSLGQR